MNLWPVLYRLREARQGIARNTGRKEREEVEEWARTIADFVADADD